MAVASFEVFCSHLCALIGAPVPTLEPGPTGVVAFTVCYRDATVGFIKPDDTMEPGVLMMVVFGAPPEDIEDDVLRVVLDSNFLMLGMDAPMFARNPATREISLHRSFTLLQADVHTILNAVVQAAEMAANWKRTYFLGVPLEEGAGVRSASREIA